MMKKHTNRRRVLLAALAASAALALSGLPGTAGRVSATPALAECEGDACSQVTFTFDEGKGQYLARNNSSDRWVKVSASNLSSFASACLGPGKSDYLKLKSVVGPYRAEYDEGCGANALGG